MNKNRWLPRWCGVHGVSPGAEFVIAAAEHAGHLLAWAAQQGLSGHERLAMPSYRLVIEEGLRTGCATSAASCAWARRWCPQCLDCGPGARPRSWLEGAKWSDRMAPLR